jgi:uncharacterized protein YgiM (DUF1202 family)
MFKFRRYPRLLLILIAFILSAVTNLVGKSDSHVFLVKDSSLYKEPSIVSSEIVKINFPEKIEIIGERKNDFYQARVNGKKGWIPESDISITPKEWMIYQDGNFSFAMPRLFAFDTKTIKSSEQQLFFGDVSIALTVLTDDFNKYMGEAIKSQNAKLQAFSLKQEFQYLNYYKTDAYYCKSEYTEGIFKNSIFYILYIKNKSNGINQITVCVKKNRNLASNEILGKKIIFSYNLNSYYINISVLNIRSKPDSKSNIIGVIKQNEPFFIIQKTDLRETLNGIPANWFKIKSITGMEGYIFGGFFVQKCLMSQWHNDDFPPCN